MRGAFSSGTVSMLPVAISRRIDASCASFTVSAEIPSSAARQFQLAPRLRKERALRRAENEMLEMGGCTTRVATAAQHARPFELALHGLRGGHVLCDDALPDRNRVVTMRGAQPGGYQQERRRHFGIVRGCIDESCRRTRAVAARKGKKSRTELWCRIAFRPGDDAHSQRELRARRVRPAAQCAGGGGPSPV